MASGYEAAFVIELQSRHKCTICVLPMRNPVQTGCGHLFCKTCLEPELQRYNPRCPVDQERISRDETFPDNACKREILQLQVRCNHYSSGCAWIGELKKLEYHLETCEFRQLKCTQCGLYVEYVYYKTHLSNECPKRLSACQLCGMSVQVDQLELHNKTSCPSSLHKCPNNCDPNKEFRLSELQKHLEVKGGDCPLHKIRCPYYQLGCIFQSSREEMASHFEISKIYHAQLTVEVIMETKTTAKILTKEQKQFQENLDTFEAKLTIVDELDNKIDEKCSFLETKHGALLERVEVRLKEQILKLKLETEGLHRQMKPPSYSSSPYPSVPEAYNSTMNQRVDNLSAKVTDMDHTLNTFLNHNLDCDVRIQLLERATFDGTFLWKIDNYTERRTDAINGTTLSLYSSPFYTSKQGYKMCARVYLNGDGSGKNTHLSFFFCVMRGPNDALLPWPFHQKVTLLLLNQNGQKNVIDQFRPDTQSTSFQRPIHREMNIASGCPTFCPLSELHNGFVKDDCIFLGVIVDTLGIPKPVSFSLN